MCVCVEFFRKQLCMNILSIGGIISPSQQLVIDTPRPDLYRAHSSDSSSSRRDTNLSSVHATWPADANRDTASWMQAWSQWLFCSWHGLCLIGICRTDWSCGGGYGNAPAESIKWGDTLDHMMDRGLMSHRGSGAARTEVEEWEYHLRLWA